MVDEEEPEAVTVVGFGVSTGVNLPEDVGEGVGEAGATAGEGAETVGEGEPGELTSAGLGEGVGEGIGEAGATVRERVPEDVEEGELGGITGAGLVAGPVIDEPVLSSITDPNESEKPTPSINPSDTEVIARM